MNYIGIYLLHSCKVYKSLYFLYSHSNLTRNTPTLPERQCRVFQAGKSEAEYPSALHFPNNRLGNSMPTERLRSKHANLSKCL